jgi:hypothetical protein
MSPTDTYTARQRFAVDVLNAALGGGIQHWARVTAQTTTGPAGAIAAEGIDLADDRSFWHVTLSDVEKAIDKVIDRPEDCFGPDAGIDPVFSASIPTLLRAIRDELTSHGYPLPQVYAERVDAVMGDIVVQVAVADEVIY